MEGNDEGRRVGKRTGSCMWASILKMLPPMRACVIFDVLFLSHDVLRLQMVESRWASELSALQASQRHEYRDCVVKLHEDSHFSVDTRAASSPAYRHACSMLSSWLVFAVGTLSCTGHHVLSRQRAILR